MTYLTRVPREYHRITGEALEAQRLVQSLEADERRIFTAIVHGSSLRAIAQESDISKPQAEAIRCEILRKMGVGTTADLIRIGVYAGIDAAAPCT